MDSSNENDILIDQNGINMSFDQNRHFTVPDTCSLHYSEMIDREQLNENQEYMTDSDSFSFHSCEHQMMDPFHVNNSHSTQKNCIAGMGHSPEYIHHLGHVEIRTPDTTDFCCSHMSDDSVCLERSFTLQNTSFRSSQDIEMIDISPSSIAELSVIQNKILPMPNDNSLDPIPSNISMFSAVLTENVLYSKPQDIQDVSILENVYLSHAIDYQPNRSCEASTIISHDGTVIATLQPMVSHRLSYNEVSTTVADDSFSHAISPALSESPLKEDVISTRRKVDPRIKILLTMDTEDLDKALRDIPEIDVTGFRRLNVSSFDKLMKVKRASEPNFDPLIVEAIIRSPGKKASKTSIFEYIISNYELSIYMKKAHNLFCDSMLSLLNKKIIYRKRGTGLRGLFQVSKDHLETLKKLEEKRESFIDFYTSDLEEYDMIKYD